MPENTQDVLLPIGSVVKVADIPKRLIIIGILQKRADTDEIFDYLGVPYPEGYVSDAYRYLFNTDQIEEFVFAGFVDSEYQLYRSQVVQSEDYRERFKSKMTSDSGV